MISTKAPPRLTIVLAVFVMLIATVSSSAQEPLPLGTAIEGTYTGASVYYTVDLSAGQLLILDLQSEDFDTRVAIEQDGNELAADDDGGQGDNSLLAYVVQSDGSYDIVVEAFFFDADSGAFTLLANVSDPTLVAADETVTLEPEADGSSRLYAVLESSAGSVVNILATTTGDERLRMGLVGTDAGSIETDSDDGVGDNSLIRRVVLPNDGYYLITVDHASSNTLLMQPVEVAVEASEQLFLSAEPQELVLGNGEGQKGTEVYTIDVTQGVTYRIIMTIESLPNENAGVSLALFDTGFFFDPVLETRHTTGVVWEYTANETGQIRLDVHPNFFGRRIEVINYTIALEVVE